MEYLGVGFEETVVGGLSRKEVSVVLLLIPLLAVILHDLLSLLLTKMLFRHRSPSVGLPQLQPLHEC